MTAQLVRFGTVGVANTLIAAGVFAAARGAGVPELVAAPAGFAVGALNGYLWNGRWTFRARPRGALHRYLAVQLTAAASTDALLSSGLPYPVVLVCVTLFSFTACRIWAFRSAEDAGVAERVMARLRPHAHAVRPEPDRDLRDEPAGARRDRVHDPVVATRKPQHLPVG
jgi:putative flippase GtrA